MTALIGHLDADCFYVSAERVRYDGLRGKPVGVLGNQGACVIAKSYELKAHGVATGMSIWDVVPRCPEAIFVKRDFRWYETLSRRLLDLLNTVSPTVEYYSIDEMFFSADELPSACGATLADAAAALQLRILREIGIPVSVGISRSRTLAKLASDARKPFGCTVLLDADEIRTFLADQPVIELCGVARRSAAKLAAHGIRTCLEFADADRRSIRKLLTVKGEALWWELRGEPVVPIQVERAAHKRISRGGSLGETTTDRDRLTAWIVRNVERLIEELDFHGVHTGRLVLWLEYKRGGGWIGATRTPEPTARFEMIAQAALGLLASWDEGEAVCGMQLEAERLSDRGIVQGDLFPLTDDRADRVADVKREVNRKLGRFALRSAATLPLTEIYRDEATGFDICDIRGKTCF